MCRKNFNMENNAFVNYASTSKWISNENKSESQFANHQSYFRNLWFLIWINFPIWFAWFESRSKCQHLFFSVDLKWFASVIHDSNHLYFGQGFEIQTTFLKWLMTCAHYWGERFWKWKEKRFCRLITEEKRSRQFIPKSKILFCVKCIERGILVHIWLRSNINLQMSPLCL